MNSKFYAIRSRAGLEKLGLFIYESWAKAFFLSTLTERNDGQVYELIDEDNKVISKAKSVLFPRELGVER